MQLKSGDCFVLPHGHPFCLATDLGLAVDFRTSLLSAEMQESAPSSRTSAVAGVLHLSAVISRSLPDKHANILLATLPPFVHDLQKQSDKAVLRWSIERLMEELREPQPGGGLIAQHLAHTMLLQALRLHLSDGPQRSSGLALCPGG